MARLKYGWLQDVLADLIRFAAERRLHDVAGHLDQALRQVRVADAARTEASEASRSTTVRLALEDCLNLLTDLKEHTAAQDVRNALHHIDQSGHAQNLIRLKDPGRGDS